MTCTCIETVNDQLAKHNTRLSQAMMFFKASHPGLMLQTDQIQTGRGKPKAVSMFLTYCPFCGVRYEELAE